MANMHMYRQVLKQISKRSSTLLRSQQLQPTISSILSCRDFSAPASLACSCNTKRHIAVTQRCSKISATHHVPSYGPFEDPQLAPEGERNSTLNSRIQYTIPSSEHHQPHIEIYIRLLRGGKLMQQLDISAHNESITHIFNH